MPESLVRALLRESGWVMDRRDHIGAVTRVGLRFRPAVECCVGSLTPLIMRDTLVTDSNTVPTCYARIAGLRLAWSGRVSDGRGPIGAMTLMGVV